MNPAAVRRAVQVRVPDLLAASTVMQYQVITTGERWWARDVQAPLFEAAVLSQKTDLDTARAGVLADRLTFRPTFNQRDGCRGDDVLVNKAARIEGCVARAREGYERNPAPFATDFRPAPDGGISQYRGA